MIEQQADLWEHGADWTVIATNLTVNREGEAVMGRGCALEAAQRHPRLAKAYGTYILGRTPPHDADLFTYGSLICLPTKRNWRQPSDLALIEAGVEQLLRFQSRQADGTTFALPRLGCGFGGLRWETVRPILAQRLVGDCWTVVHR